jgi:hypothetical protein
MAQLSPAVKEAIELAIIKYRAHLTKLYVDGDVGSITTDVGADMIHIKSTPVRKDEPVVIERGRMVTMASGPGSPMAKVR